MMVKKLPLVFSSPEKIKALRKLLKLSQVEFWERIGITQSGGSRYEAGRSIPLSTLMLLQIVYGTERESTALVDFLRSR